MERTAEFPLLPFGETRTLIASVFCLFAEKNMGVEQERHQDLQDEGEARGEKVERAVAQRSYKHPFADLLWNNQNNLNG